MVNLAYLRKYYQGKKVWLSGHTGFKGSWMLQVLSLMGAEVRGYSLAPEHTYDLYNSIQGDDLCEKSTIHDIRDVEKVKSEILEFQPDFVFHLAAQPLVLKGYQEPLYTFEVNGQGTANVLNALRFLEKPCVAVMITTDKVYENKDVPKDFIEDDKLGGHDPYSASKAVSEIMIASYRSSFFAPAQYEKHLKSIVSVRAGNVIGGGDFADNRIIPDIIHSIKNDKNVFLRYPKATRPWQHVLEPIGAYLFLATKMVDQPTAYCSAYNIGPESTDVLRVEELTNIAFSIAGKGKIEYDLNAEKLHEAATLMLDIHKIKNEIQWSPKMNAQKAIEMTIQWYLDEQAADIKCLHQINEYFDNVINDANNF
ncbi:MAG: CDP-glucose 4,6-dehydratase [Chitinophagaceae bacterium]|nr:CDP-glucose 4,6-dehydratase [Chitinophagaceae bacterium]